MTGTVQAGAIAFQGEPGANSHLACRDAYPALTPLPCATFDDAFAAVAGGVAALGMIAMENSLAGRVADVHHLLPGSGLTIVAEHYERIRHRLLALPGAAEAGLRTVHSHVQALSQCRRKLRALGLAAVVEADTAGAARLVAEAGDPTRAAIASSLAAEIHGLAIVNGDIADGAENTTRFLVLAAEPMPLAGDGPLKTSLVFRVRNIPAALYKALGGFATNGVNMTKLESYQPDGDFQATMFYAEIDGAPDAPPVVRALEELAFYSAELRLLGTYATAVPPGPASAA